MRTAKTKCVNGDLQSDDLVMSTPIDGYSCMIGKVRRVELNRTAELNTEKNDDDVYVDFTVKTYSERRIKEIEEVLSALYGQNQRFNECQLDDVIMAPSSLIRITGMTDDLLNILLDSGYKAACYCYSVLNALLTQQER